MEKIILLYIFLAINILTIAQNETKEKEAFELSQKAMDFIDFGKPDKAIECLEQSIKLDPTNFNYPYELGYVYKLQKDFTNAILIYKKAIKYKETSDQCFQMLGNVYLEAGQKENAIKIYKKGLKKFPNSGKLYFELGNCKDNESEKVIQYERGIAVDPTYPTNYYVVTKYYLEKTDKEMWGLIYGELFLNIERGSARTEEISKLIYDKYKSEIKFNSKNSFSISFYNATLSPEKTTIPFGLKIYEPLITIAILGVDSIQIASLNSIRTKFNNTYFEKNHNKEYPNILFDWQKLLIENGYFECYNYWLLMKGNPTEFHAWYTLNIKKYDEFINWFAKNKLLLTDKNKFVRFED
ncbi:MAG: tetratricopeptide repeat protein [Flavobacteriia bacterium]|nr:tetratricopeptide repeat protein [Flavobacteriia bacterium]